MSTRTPKKSSDKLRVALLGAGHERLSRDTVASVQQILRQHATLSFEDLDGYDASDWSQLPAEMAVVLGGDGSILRAARYMARNQIPLLGVNLGKLGFLADITLQQLPEIFPAVAAGRFRVVDHLMFDCVVERHGQPVAKTLGLNEVAVLVGPPFRIMELQLRVDGELATLYRCDGLIISTPVGSTAHNLSAGGPILEKSLRAFVISAISPHTLTVRPVVDSADRVYELSLPNPDSLSTVVVDGQPIHQMLSGDRVVVQRAEPRFQLIEVAGHGYYRTLREKLGWAGHIKARSES